jgi:hypothetical protein
MKPKEDTQMRKKIFHMAILLVLLGVGLFGMVLNVSADGVYHTERLNLEPVGGTPLRSGSVINIHANGPNIYAREMYELNGASVNTTYQVVLHIYLSNTSCSGAADLVVPTAVLSTNISGNGIVEHVFTPEDADAAGLHGLTVGAQWQVWNGTRLDYETGCTVVTLD